MSRHTEMQSFESKKVPLLEVFLYLRKPEQVFLMGVAKKVSLAGKQGAVAVPS